jgi:hypothetical protein
LEHWFKSTQTGRQTRRRLVSDEMVAEFFHIIIFPSKGKGPLHFISLKRKIVCYKPPNGEGYNIDHLMYIRG